MATLVRSYAQYTMDSKPYTSADTITLRDTSTILQALSASDIADLSANNVDFLDASNDVLRLTVDQYQALGTVGLSQSDLVLVSDLGTNIEGFTAGEIGGLQAKGVSIV